VIDFDVRHYDSIGSTNDEALRLARDGAAHGTVVCAREQTAGRGRHARHWHSPVGNLYASLLLRPDVPPAKAAELSFVTALAVADTADILLPDGVKAELKWPNDVLVRGAKIAGILVEYAEAAVIIGIGVNVRHVPSNTSYPVTSLIDRGADTQDPEPVLHALLPEFAHRFLDWQTNGFTTTRTAWLERAHVLGSSITVAIGGRSIVGAFSDLASDGALIVQTADGPVRIVAGEVMVLRPM
jgi:BirA family biotin operon repressor/biotin-[acetyl-CoA-carboxylase] ligase